MKVRFLTRKVKSDSKGSYVSFGGCRIRPLKKTKFLVGSEIKIMKLSFGLWCCFSSIDWYEEWK